MSYVKTTWASGDTITSEKLNNAEGGIEAAYPLQFPVTVTNGEGGVPEATTTADFSDVKAAVLAERTVEAKVTLTDNNICLFIPLRAFSPDDDPTALSFESVVDLSGGANPTPQLIKATFTANGITLAIIDLEIAQA